MLVALLLLYISTPSPTVLSVLAVDAETGDPVPGAAVQIRGQSGAALPTATTNETGVARFEDLPPEPAYLIQVQQIDYDITYEPGVVVTERKETQVAIPLPPNPEGRLYAGLDGARVAEIDTASLLMMQTFHLPDAKQGATRHIQVHPDKELLYVTADNDGFILDSRTRAPVEQFEVEGTVETLSTDGHHLYIVTSQYNNPGQLLTLDAQSGALVDHTETDNPLTSPRLLWRPDGQEIYVVEPTNGSLWMLSATPQEVLTDTPTGAYPKEGFVSADGQYRFTWSARPFQQLQTIYQTMLTPILTNQPLPVNTSALSFSPVAQELYVLDSQLGTLSILDPLGEELPLLVAVGKRPTAIAVSADGVWAYVANRESETISVVHLPSASVVYAIPVDGQPLSLAVR